MSHIFLRGRSYQYRRRVPSKYAKWDTRKFIKQSLKTDSEDIATRKAKEIDNQLEQYWAALSKGQSKNAKERFEAAQEIASTFGFEYQTFNEIAQGDLGEIVKRAMAIKDADSSYSNISAAILGETDRPELSITHALDDFFKIKKNTLRGKNDDQIRRWKNPRLKAVKNFIQLIGDKPLLKITRSDAKAFHKWWEDIIEDKGLTPNSANKDLTHMRTLYSTIIEDLQIEKATTPFDKLRFLEDEKTERLPFSVKFLKETLLNEENLKGLNEEAKWALFIMADTGIGPSEFCGLDINNGEINLNDPIPHIIIQHNSIRKLKTTHRGRKIPLVGASLYGFNNLPKGASHYKGRVIPPFLGASKVEPI